MARRSILAERDWDAHRKDDRAKIRAYFEQAADRKVYPSPAVALHVLDVLDGLADVFDLEDL